MSNDDPGFSSRVARRIRTLLGIGRIEVTTDSGRSQTAQVVLNELETIDAMPRVTEFGFSSRPPEGSEAVMVFQGGERSDGVIVGTHHAPSRPRNLEVGETQIYTASGIYIYLTNGGIVIEALGLPVTVNNATTVTVNAAEEAIWNTPILKVSGDIIDNYETNPNTMAQMRALYNEHDHPVRNVQPGSGAVTSDHPNQPQ